MNEIELYSRYITYLQEGRHSSRYNVKEMPHFEINGHKIAFHPVANVPNYTHRVVINDEPKDWLGSQAKPNAKSAIFYYEKHLTGKSK